VRVLALETATTAGGIAILDDEDGLIGEVRVNIKVAYAERLMPSIDWLLKSSHISVRDIDAFAVSIGPGSFTGLRIGLSTVKGLSHATQKPVIPVPTLDAFARTLPFCEHFICPMLDARKNEIYTGLYKWDEGVCKKIITETAINPLDFLKEIKGQTVFMGDGVRIYKELIINVLGDDAIFASPSKMSPSASNVAEIAIERLKKGVAVDPITLTPFYIRRSEAEIHWKG